MHEPRSFRGGIGMALRHALIPLLDRLGRMPGTMFVNPFQYRLVVIETDHRFLELIWIQFKEREEMFIEADSLVIVAVEQALLMQARLINQPRQMHISAQFFVW